MIGGLQILCTGAVSIFLSKVLDEVRGRPTYVVSNRLGSPFEQTCLAQRDVAGRDQNNLIVSVR